MKYRTKLLLSLMVLCTTSSVVHAKTTPIVFAKGSYCASYTGEIGNSKTFSLFLLKNQYLNVHYNANQVKVRVTDKAGKIYKNNYQENDMYIFNPIPKKATTMLPLLQNQTIATHGRKLSFVLKI